jgi:lactoylglutathione lyase
MKRLLACFLTFLFSHGAVIAAPYDHIHLAADNAQDAVNWYVKHFGGIASRFQRSMDTSLPIDRVYYGNVSVIFFDRMPSAGSVGSAVDHFGISIANVEDVVAEVVAGGGTALGQVTEFSGMKVAFVEDPWGTKVELIDDPNLRGIHHLHLASSNPPATLAWYQQNFGGDAAQFANILPGINYGDLWLLVEQSEASLAPTQGRSLDHLGWRFADLDQTTASLKSSGVSFTMEPRAYRDIRIAFVEGPDGVRIELVEP